MSVANPELNRNAARPAPGCQLPKQLRVFYIAGRQRIGGSLAEVLVSHGSSNVLLEEAIGAASGLERLREEAFDLILIGHEGKPLDALALVRAVRASNTDEPLLVLGKETEQQLLPDCLEAGADGYLCAMTATPPMLICAVQKSVERTLLVRENRRLLEAERQRVDLQRQDAQRWLAEQQFALHAWDEEPAPEHAGTRLDAVNAPAQLGSAVSQDFTDHYRELLRAYVIMGSGNLTGEINQLAQRLLAAGISAPQAMRIHLHVLEEMVRTLGTRSARHVMARADLLALEILVEIAEGYRKSRSSAPSAGGPLA